MNRIQVALFALCMALSCLANSVAASTAQHLKQPLVMKSALADTNTAWWGAPFSLQSTGICSSMPDEAAIETCANAHFVVTQYGCTPIFHFIPPRYTAQTSLGTIWQYIAPTENNPYCYTQWQGAYTSGQAAIADGLYFFDPRKNPGSGSTCDGGEGGNNNTCPTNVGDPINAVTGNKYEEETDFSSGKWLVFRRFYNSALSVNPTASDLRPALGRQWRHSYDRTLSIISTDTEISATLQRPDGRQLDFSKTNGQWSPSDADIADTLIENDDTQGAPLSYTVYIAALRHFEQYSVSGLLQSVVDETGNGVQLTYSTSLTDPAIAPKPGLLLTVTDPNNRTLGFIYDSSARLHQVNLPDGGSLIYAYDATSNNLVSVQYPDGKTRQYLYNEPTYTGNINLPGAITGVIDEANTRYQTTSYDAYGRATRAVLAGNVAAVNLTYNSDNTTKILYPLGASSTMTFAIEQGVGKLASIDNPCAPQCGKIFKSATYDANGYPSSTTDLAGVTTLTTYDSYGLLTSQVEASGTPNQRTTNTVWNTALRVPLSRTILDNNGNAFAKTSWVYNANGQITARCEVDATDAAASGYTCATNGTPPAKVRRWTYSYCTTADNTQCPMVGLLLSIDGPRTDVPDITSYNYYLSDGTSHHRGDLKSVTDALGHVTTYNDYDGAGRIARVTHANGVITDYTYTPRGWLWTRTIRSNTDGTPSSSDAITTISYTPYGAVQSITDADGIVTTYSYDAAHRLTDINDAVGNHIHYTLDASGNKTQEQTFDSTGTVRRTLSRTFNALGQLTKITDALSRTTFRADYADSYDTKGRLKHSADGLGNQRLTGYDPLDRLQQTIEDYNGTDGSTENASTTISYDPLDNVSNITDPSGLNTIYDGTGLGVTRAVHSPDAGITTNTYDAAGNLIQRIDARGVVTNLVYDALNRLSAVQYPAHPGLNITYTYDQSPGTSGCQSNYGIGHLVAMSDASGTTAWCYTNQGDISSIKQVINNVAYQHTYTYTAARRIQTLRYPSGFTLQYGRDANGQISTIGYFQQAGPFGSYTSNTITPLITNVSYFPFGEVSGYIWAQGSQSLTRTFDNNGKLTDVTSNALNLHFARDVMGNITAVGDTQGANPASETYTYDALYRIKAINTGAGSAEQAFTYNIIGDRLTAASNGQATTIYGYLSGSHKLTGVGPLPRQLDANGNTTALTAPTGALVGLGYDDRNLLTAVTSGSNTIANYQYNGQGIRVLRSITAPTSGQTASIYDPWNSGLLLGEYSSPDYREYVYIDRLPVASATDAGIQAPIVSYLYADHLGTVRAVTDTAAGSVYSWQWQNNAFGTQLKSGSMTFNLRFPGQYYDAETGLHYNGNRYYDPTVGRYLQSDPIGLAGGISTYAYVASDPFSKIDPLGLCPDEVERCRQVKEDGLEHCSDAALPDAGGRMNQSFNFFACLRQYLEDHNCGPAGQPLPEKSPDPIPSPDPKTTQRTAQTALVAILLALGASLLLSPN